MTNAIFSGNKRANAVIDTITLLVVFVTFAFVVVLSYSIFTSMHTDLSPTFGTNTTASNIMDNNYNRYVSLFDNLAVFVFIGLWIAGLIASFMVDTHPIFFGVTMILLVFVIIFGIYVSNFYQTLTASNALQASAIQFVKTSWLMNHLLAMTIAVAFSISLVLYGKMR